ncbi:hypothetical protein SAMN04490244_10112 [Tranquillimonas rosea]|uniref:Uncharacterized protein n=1 Tax=Tranquillimonas rosea TaxID=641238 RepID=A0A1H9P3S0_9RHOB|nr:hypothetical protein [Tranquillimonas rosea]SER42856.1 hypothetical protein SAMN04490244_10112 [Tranquillimonas rosea]
MHEAHSTAQETGPLGPAPRDSVLALTDLGLTDLEIARYFGVAPCLIHRLRVGAAERPPASAQPTDDLPRAAHALSARWRPPLTDGPALSVVSP